MAAHTIKTSINFIIFILIIVENCLSYDAIHEITAWIRTGSNPADINLFRSHTRKKLNDAFWLGKEHESFKNAPIDPRE